MLPSKIHKVIYSHSLIYLFQQWSQHGQALPANIGSNTNNTVEECSTKLPVLFVIEKRNHVRQEDVVRLLTSKEHAESGDAVLQ